MKKSTSFINNVIAFLLLATSGFPYFSIPIWYIIFFVLLIFVLILKKVYISKNFIFYICALSLLILSQSFKYRYFDGRTVLGLFLRVFIAYISISILGKSIFSRSIKILYYLTLISFIVYSIINIFPPVTSIIFKFGIPVLQTSANGRGLNSIIIYNLNPFYINQFRNNGPFWEPGAFGGYLNIFLAINVFLYGKKLKAKENIVFIIGIITTFSTTSYILLSLIFVTYFLVLVKSRILSLLFLFIALTIIYIASFQIPFMYNKISTQYEVAKNEEQVNIGKGGETRFTSMVFDIAVFKNSPIIGGSIYDKVRLQFFRRYSNSGITDLLAKMGILFFTLYFYSMYKGFKRWKNNGISSFIILAVVIIAGISEAFYFFPFFWALSLLGTNKRA